MEDRPFAKSTLQVFRAQLILHGKVREVFESSLRLARESGYLKRRSMKVALWRVSAAWTKRSLAIYARPDVPQFQRRSSVRSCQVGAAGFLRSSPFIGHSLRFSRCYSAIASGQML